MTEKYRSSEEESKERIGGEGVDSSQSVSYQRVSALLIVID
jgi:hypothetical protein